jgi:MFS family permease
LNPKNVPVSRARFAAVFTGNGLLRIAGAASGIVAGLYFAGRANAGEPVNTALVGVLGAAFYGSQLLAAFPMGMLSDRFGARSLMVSAGLVGAGGVGVLGLALTMPMFFLARIVEGVAAGASAPAVLSWLTGVTNRSGRLRGRVMSLFELTLLAGIALGGPVGSRMWTAFGAATFLAIAGIYFVAALLLLGATTGAKERPADALGGLRRVLRQPHVRTLAPAWLAINAIVGLWLGPMFTFLLTRRQSGAGGQYLVGLFADRPEAVGWVFLGYALVFGSGLAAWSFFLGRAGPKRVLHVGLTAMFGVCAGLYVLNHSISWSDPARGILLAVIAALVMVESGFTPAALALLADLTGREAHRGAAMGLYSALLGMGAVVGALVASALDAWFGVDGLIHGTVIFGVIALGTLGRLPNSENA